MVLSYLYQTPLVSFYYATLSVATVLFLSLLGLIVFLIYDIFRLQYLKALQRQFLERRISQNSSIIPFVIAPKKQVFFISTAILSAPLIASIPLADIWVSYDVVGIVAVVMVLCCLLSFVVRGTRHPKHYNKAVRHYFRGDLGSAVKFARKSTRSKRNPARMWLAAIVQEKANKNLQ